MRQLRAAVKVRACQPAKERERHLRRLELIFSRAECDAKAIAAAWLLLAYGFDVDPLQYLLPDRGI